jgi:hypothetical protein
VLAPTVPKPTSKLDFIFCNIEKTAFQQLPISTTNLCALEKSNVIAQGYIYVRVSIGQSEGEKIWERIRSRTMFLLQMYKRERKYKSSLGDSEIVCDS